MEIVFDARLIFLKMEYLCCFRQDIRFLMISQSEILFDHWFLLIAVNEICLPFVGSCQTKIMSDEIFLHSMAKTSLAAQN